MTSTVKKGKHVAKACRGCALLCDDGAVAVSNESELKFSRFCLQGEAWYRSRLDRKIGAGCTVKGRPADCHVAARAVAALLENATAPLYAGMEWLDTRSQQVLVDMVRQTGGFVSPVFSESGSAGLKAFQRYGRATSTLGEIGRHRGLVCFWNVEPDDVPPRLVEKCLQQSESVWSVGSSVSNELPGSPELGDRYRCLVSAREDQLQLIRQLRAKNTDAATELPGSVQELFDQFQLARHVTLFIGKGQGIPAGNDPVIDGLHQLARSLNSHIPCVILELGSSANAVSAREVLGWSTGQFTSGAFVAGRGASNEDGESLRNRLLNRNYDTAILIESQFADVEVVAALSKRGERRLVCLDSAPGPLAKIADVAVNICEAGWDVPGDFFRMDGLPIGLDPVVASDRVYAKDFLESVLAAMGGVRA